MLAVRDAQAAHRGAQRHFPAAALDGRAATVVEFAERDAGNADAVAGAIREKRFPENVEAVARVDAVEFFIERADQDDAPETAIARRSGRACAATRAC